jgi:unsaturated chondroitin disaccharide hydrolase
MKINTTLTAKSLAKPIQRTLELAQSKVRSIDNRWNPDHGTPVFTVAGKYATRGWTEWTQGFQYGCAILTYDGTDDLDLHALGLRQTVDRMAHHVTHIGVHDHGFNNLSTYGNLRRLMIEGRTPLHAWEMAFYDMALKASGAVQAARWQGTHPAADPRGKKLTADAPALGYIYSFNGPHSLFVDTMRTTRILGVAWQLGHKLMHENDKAADLLKRLVLHGLTTNQYITFHGDSDHSYDVRGRTAHEAVFNRNDGRFRCRSSQQGYSPFSTWTRGLAWAMLGYAEELEFFETIDDKLFEESVGLKKRDVVRVYEQAAIDTCDHYINDVTAKDGIVYWDDGAPGLPNLKNWRDKDADPYNDHEPVDASASAIAAQGLLRLGRSLGAKGAKYTQAGLTVTRTLLDEPYLSIDRKHEGLLLHSIYHRPNNWDFIPKGRKIPSGESSMWGDYHLLELCVYLKRTIEGGPYLTFFA